MCSPSRRRKGSLRNERVEHDITKWQIPDSCREILGFRLGNRLLLLPYDSYAVRVKLLRAQIFETSV